MSRPNIVLEGLNKGSMQLSLKSLLVQAGEQATSFVPAKCAHNIIMPDSNMIPWIMLGPHGTSIL
jgi:hypothetical protein